MAERTHYEVIDADPKGSKADLKAAYAASLEAAQAASDGDEIAAVRRAWQVLSDPVQRQRYDEEIGLTGRGGGATADEIDEIDEIDEADEGDEGDEVDEVEGEPLTPKELRHQLFHHVPDYLEQPTLGRRLAASMIDVITLLAVFAGLGAIVNTATSNVTAQAVAMMVFFEIWVMALFIVPTLRTGQTLGKRFTYIMTVDRETGNLASVGQVVRRYIVPMIAVPLLLPAGGMGAFLALFYGLSYLMAKDQLSLADRLGKTVVVVARYRPTRGDAAA